MSKVTIGRDRIKIVAPEGLTKEQLATRNLIVESLSFRKNDFFFSEEYQRGNWDGYYCLYRKGKIKLPNGRFSYNGDKDWYSTGHLQNTLGSWIRLGLEIEDQRNLPVLKINPDLSIFAGLREYQREAVSAIINNKKHGLPTPRGIIHLPPRTGKTRIAIALLEQVQSRPAVFIVERVDLARQTQAAMAELLSEPIGLVGDGNSDIRDITVVTIQSLHAAFGMRFDTRRGEYKEATPNRKIKLDLVKLIRGCEILIIDEAHHIVSRSYREAFRKAVNAWCVIGLSGTPWIDDGSDLLLSDGIGPIIYHRGYSYMVRNKFLVPLNIYFYRLSKVLCYSGNYQAVYRAAVVDNPIKEYLIVGAAKSLIKAGKSVAILVTQIQHAKRLGRLIPNSVVLTGQERGVYRYKVFRQLDKKRVMCIISTVFSEGIDVPSLDAGINADGGMDSRRIFQRMRMMTPSPGKTKGIFIDFYHLEKYLKKHSKIRLSYYQKEPSFQIIEKDLRASLMLRFRNQVPLEDL